MTFEVKQAMALLPIGKSTARKATSNLPEKSFGDTVRFDKPARQGARPEVTTKLETEAKTDVDAVPHWVAFLAKLDKPRDAPDRPDATASRGEVDGCPKDEPVVATGCDLEVEVAEDEREKSRGEKAPETTPAHLAIPGTYLQPMQLRRTLGSGVEENDGRPTDAGLAKEPTATDDRPGGDSKAVLHVASAATATTSDVTKPITPPTVDPAPSQSLSTFGEIGQLAEPKPRGSDSKPVDAPRLAARVTVISEQNFPAPILSTQAHLAEQIASDLPSAAAVDRPSFQSFQAHAGAVSTHSLKIQLHPAELGMVTANLRFAGEQLSIEIKVDNADAYHRLSSDSDTIVNTLRGLGYDIDRVTVLQPSLVANTPARSEAGAPLSGQTHPGADQPGSGATGSGGNGTRGQQSGGSDGDARQGSDRAAPRQGDRASGSLYI